jgi:hypothetical protein
VNNFEITIISSLIPCQLCTETEQQNLQFAEGWPTKGLAARSNFFPEFGQEIPWKA